MMKFVKSLLLFYCFYSIYYLKNSLNSSLASMDILRRFCNVIRLIHFKSLVQPEAIRCFRLIEKDQWHEMGYNEAEGQSVFASYKKYYTQCKKTLNAFNFFKNVFNFLMRMLHARIFLFFNGLL